ncbi:macrolide family glycosyltransferase [Streptomyces malaysiensis]|uniref:Antibiotic resistance macrolide glycosyltransferase n=1 Tax=Streptomyces malaysiensis TaxID=92644 RepID=A0A7X6AUA2_STRMQ|nr:macrolide family glycosyltransferase [Streptomyces malaysiensis]NIY62420.1 antibiotic resistance macrolide glycosyltransferase [Streptomyces malaysiensis]
MSHLAMVSIAHHGHVNPSLGIVRELVARGHRVSYAIPDEGDFVERVRATGAEPRVWKSTLPAAGDDPEAWGETRLDLSELFLTDAVQALPQLAALYRDDVPDLVLSDISGWAAQVLAHRWGVPYVQFSPNLVPWEGYEEEIGAQLARELKSSERGRAYYARWHSWLAENGLAGTDPDTFMGRPPRSLVLIPPALQPYADRVDSRRYSFVGACQGDRAGQGVWRRPAAAAAAGKRVALVSLGSNFTKQPGFYRACAAAFGGLPDWHLVLQVGRQVTEQELGTVPDNVEVHSWVPQLDVLRQADLFVTHAGAGGAQEGLATGTPMLCVPQAADQFGNANRLVLLGVAECLDTADATAEALRAAVLRLADDPAVAARCAAERERTAAGDGSRRAADLVEAELPG